jgi:hypothetical protein
MVTRTVGTGRPNLQKYTRSESLCRWYINTIIVSGYYPWSCFYLNHIKFRRPVSVGSIKRNCPFSDEFYSDNTPILRKGVKYCMDIGARPQVCGVFQLF